MDAHQQAEQFNLGIDAVGFQVLADFAFRFLGLTCAVKHIYLGEMVDFFFGDGREIGFGLLERGHNGVRRLGLQEHLTAHQLAFGAQTGRVSRCLLVGFPHIYQRLFIVALRVTCHAQGKEGGGRFARIVHRLCGIQFSKEALFLQVEHVLPFVCLGQGMVQLVTVLPVLATGCVVSCHEHHGQRAVLILFIPELHGCVIQTLHDGGGIAVGRHPLFLSPAATCHEDEQRDQ